MGRSSVGSATPSSTRSSANVATTGTPLASAAGSTVSPPQTQSAILQNIGAIHMVTSSVGWLVDSLPAGLCPDYAVYHTTDGSTDWHLVNPSGVPSVGAKPFFLNANAAWASVWDKNTVTTYRTTDGGTAWTKGGSASVPGDRCSRG